MGNRIKIMIMALLGFSTACSSVKNAPKQAGEPSRNETEVPDSLVNREGDDAYRIRVMYGVPNPRTGEMVTPLQENPDAGQPAETPKSE